MKFLENFDTISSHLEADLAVSYIQHAHTGTCNKPMKSTSSFLILYEEKRINIFNRR